MHFRGGTHHYQFLAMSTVSDDVINEFYGQNYPTKHVFSKEVSILNVVPKNGTFVFLKISHLLTLRPHNSRTNKARNFSLRHWIGRVQNRSCMYEFATSEHFLASNFRGKPQLF